VRRTIFLLAAASLILAAMVPASASASTQPAAGTFIEHGATITDVREADGNIIIKLTRLVTFTGSYVGEGLADERIVIHKDGRTNVHITIAFIGTACGLVPTELDFLVIGQGQLDEDLETGTIAGSYTVIRNGVGHGNGKFSGMAGVGGDYEGQMHCD
jgi:hypothetical protein